MNTAERIDVERNALRCLTMKAEGETLLLPAAAVAEIVAWERPEPLDDAPAWILGTVYWRHRAIPLASFAVARGANPLPPTRRARIAVCHAQRPGAKLPFIGILLDATPRPFRASEGNVRLDGQGNGPFALASVHTGAESALVPDLAALTRVAEAFVE